MMKMKKMIALVLALLLAFSLVACGKKPQAENKYNTITPGVLTVATSPDYAPYEFYAIGADGKADLAGFDIALIKYIADYLVKAGVGRGWRVYISHAAAMDKAELALAKLKEAMPEAIFEILPLSPAFITQGGPECVAVQYIKDEE